jgi:hypothetical protein
VVPDTPRLPAAIEVWLVGGERLIVPDGVESTRLREVLAAVVDLTQTRRRRWYERVA